MSIKTMSLSELNIIGIQVNLPTGFLGEVETFILSNKTNKIWTGVVIITKDKRKIIAQYNIKDKKIVGIEKTNINYVIDIFKDVIEKEDEIDALRDISKKLNKIEKFRDRILINNKIGIYITNKEQERINEGESYIEFKSISNEIITNQTIIIFGKSEQKTVSYISEEQLYEKYEDVKKINYLENLLINIVIDDIQYYECGSIIRAEKNDKILKIVTEPLPSFLLRMMEINNLTINNTNAIELFDLIARNSGVTSLNEEQLSQIKRKQVYRVIGVIYNLEIQDDKKVVIGDIELNGNVDLTIEEKSILFSDNMSKSKFTYVISYVEANTKYDAQVQAINVIKSTVDMIKILYRNSTFFKYYSNIKELDTWNMKIFFTNITVGKNLFIQNIPNINSKVLINIDNTIKSHYSITDENQSLNDYNEVFGECLINNSKELNTLRKSAYWLNKMLDTNDIEESIIHFNTSLEFCLNGEIGKTMLEGYEKNDELIEKLKILINEMYTEENYFCNKEKNSQTLKIYKESKEKIKDKLSASINSEYSLISKLEKMEARLNLNLSEKDIKIIKKLRRARNSTIHGYNRNQEVERLELYEGYAILSRIIIHKYIEKGGINIESY